MKVLFIGGTGVISTAASSLALDMGFELYLMNRGNNSRDSDMLEKKGAKFLTCDINDEYAASALLSGHDFDCVINWICYTPQDIERDYRLFNACTRQYIYISSASAYTKPVTSYPITESAPIGNSLWDYAQRKAECEILLNNLRTLRGFPATIVRPSHTYSSTKLPVPLSGAKTMWTYVERMMSGKPVVVHGDGRSLWTVTHSTDFAKAIVGLIGNFSAIGHAFHITSDEALTWDRIVTIECEILGVQPNILHIPSDYIAKKQPQYSGGLLGDKAESLLFDNSKIKSFVPSFICTTPFHIGVREVISLLLADRDGQVVDEDYNAIMDEMATGFASL